MGRELITMEMDPLEKMEKLTKDGRDFRRFAKFEVRTLEENEEKELWVEGYAVRFNEPTILWEYDGKEYKEQVDDRAFDDADMSDVIFNYNHSGKVMARTRNKTLQLSIDDKGLYIKARVDGTEEGRKIYEEIKGGYIDRMSYSYTVTEAAYDSENRIRTVRKIKKLYDVSAVDIPAYDTTSIYARSLINAEEEAGKKLKEVEEKRKRLILLTQL
jgi:hypothetical protein